MNIRAGLMVSIKKSRQVNEAKRSNFQEINMGVNKFDFHRRSLADLLSFRSHSDFHQYLFRQAIDRYVQHVGEPENLGTVLAVCAWERDAQYLADYNFEKILLTGVLPPTEAIESAMKADPRIEYRQMDCENLQLESASYDLVFCKEGLHHLALPVQGLYEMLRVCRKAVVFVEGYDSAMIRLAGSFGLASDYEPNMIANVGGRKNYVFRWGKRHLKHILTSYYLDSGYHVDMTLGWMSGRLSLDRSRSFQILFAFLGYALSFFPGCMGNFMTAMITPGSDVPEPSRLYPSEAREE